MRHLVAASAAFLFCSTVLASPSSAAAGTSDTATPVYVSSSTPITGVNEFRCIGHSCSLLVTTKTTAYPCTSELVVVSGSSIPALLYQNTHCAVSISGQLYRILGEGGDVCELDGAQTMRVSFSSGANSAYNGTFPATATFKPTAVTTSRYVTRARVTVKAGGQLYNNPLASGTITASFEVSFPSPGLDTACYFGSTRGLTTVAAGTVTTRF